MDTASAPNRRLIAWLIGTTFLTYLVFLHVTFAHEGGAGLRLPFNAAVWMGFALMMALAMWPAARGVIRFSAFHKGLGLLLLALWLPFLWSWNEASLIALPRMLGVTAGAILLLGLTQLELTRRDWWLIGLAILSASLVETLLGYIQLFDLGPEGWGYFNTPTDRPAGTFRQVNVMASFLVTGLVVSAWLFNEAKGRLAKAVTLLAPLLIPALVLVIQSRSGWLAALIVTPLLMLHLWHLDRKRFRTWGAMLVAGIILAAFLWWAPWAEQGTVAKAVSNPGERLPVYLHSLRMILEEPLSGWGYGRFQHDFLFSFADWRASLAVNQPKIVEPIINARYGHPHNELLLWAIEGGVLPMLAILSFAGWMAWRLCQHGPKGERLVMLALLIPLALHSMTEYPFYHSAIHWLTFLLLIGFISNQCWPMQKKKNRFTFGVKISALAGAPLLCLFLATHLQALWVVKDVVLANKPDVTMNEVINPMGTPYYFSHKVNKLQLTKALGSNNKINIFKFAKLIEKNQKLKPDPSSLRLLIEAWHALDKEIKLEATQKKLEYLFQESHIPESVNPTPKNDANPLELMVI